MGKQIFDRTKKTIAILLVVLFLATLTAAAVSATKDNFDSTWGPISQQNYNNAYANQKNVGSSAGNVKGLADGKYNCEHGTGDEVGDGSKYHKATSYTSAAKLGAVDGYNDGFDSGYQYRYSTAYKSCKDAGNENLKLV